LGLDAHGGDTVNSKGDHSTIPFFIAMDQENSNVLQMRYLGSMISIQFFMIGGSALDTALNLPLEILHLSIGELIL